MASSRSYYCTDSVCFYAEDSDDDEEYFDIEDTEDDDSGEATPPDSDTGPFDFARYLASLTGDTWSVCDLTDGNANHTVRATKLAAGGLLRPQGPAGKRLEAFSSVVLKYAPPYFYKSPEMKFDPYRQTVEAKVLAILHDTTSPLYPVTQSTRSYVSIPTLIDHSPSQSVLIQSDLGNIPTVDKFLSSPHTSLDQATQAGILLAMYLAELHRCVQFTSNPTKAVSDLENSLANSFIEPTMVDVIGASERFMRMSGVPDYEDLGKRARNNWIARERSVFGQGDIWYGTVLVNVTENKDLTLGICDWELAGPNHPAGDIAQFGSYLQLSTLSPLVNDDQRLRFHAFSDAFYPTYLNGLVVDDMDEFRRTLLILHGWELVNASAWRHYLWCKCSAVDSCLCPHTVEMVHLGASMLRAAGDQEVRWDELKNVEWIDHFFTEKIQ